MHTSRTNMSVEYKPTKTALPFPQAKKYNRPGLDYRRCHRFKNPYHSVGLFEYLHSKLNFFFFLIARSRRRLLLCR